MFNTFLTNILNSYLGEIVEDLDIDNLGSGAINGDILLIDLKLRPDALVKYNYRSHHMIAFLILLDHFSHSLSYQLRSSMVALGS